MDVCMCVGLSGPPPLRECCNGWAQVRRMGELCSSPETPVRQARSRPPRPLRAHPCHVCPPCRAALADPLPLRMHMRRLLQLTSIAHTRAPSASSSRLILVTAAAALLTAERVALPLEEADLVRRELPWCSSWKPASTSQTRVAWI